MSTAPSRRDASPASRRRRRRRPSGSASTRCSGVSGSSGRSTASAPVERAGRARPRRGRRRARASASTCVEVLDHHGAPRRGGARCPHHDPVDQRRARGADHTSGPGTSARPSSSNTTAASAHAEPVGAQREHPGLGELVERRHGRSRRGPASSGSGPRTALRMPSRSATWSSVRSKFMRSAPAARFGRPSSALADDVALDLRRARRDRERERPQPLLDACRRRRRARPRSSTRSDRSPSRCARLGVGELDHRARRRPGTPVACGLRHVALASAPTARRARRRGARARAGAPGRATTAPRSSASRQRVDHLAHERGAPLERERHLRDAPAVVLRARPGCATGTRTSSRNTSQNSDEPEHRLDRPHLDAGQVHRQDQPA